MNTNLHGHHDCVICSVDDSVLRITINRPDAMNALDQDTQTALASAFDQLESDDTLRVAIITGAGGRSFCTGSDLKYLAAHGHPALGAGGYAGLIHRFDRCKPVIAAVNGYAVGGGLEIVLASDLAVAADHARFGLPEPRVGLTATGGLHRLARHVPMKTAMEIALRGHLFDASQAQAYGLINRVVPAERLMAEADALAEEICLGAPLAIAGTLDMIRTGLDEPTLQAAYERTYPSVESVFDSADAREGMRAFAQKRKPEWQGY